MYDKNLYEKALSIISKRRLDAKVLNDNHFKEAEKRIPEIIEINRQLANTSMDLFKTIKEGGLDMGNKIQWLKTQNMQAQHLVEHLLTLNGLPADYLDIKYSCDKCSDTGFCGAEMCSCLKELLLKLAVDELNAHAQIKLCSFSSFSLNYYKGVTMPDGTNCFESMSKVFNYCVYYTDNFNRNSKSIFMLGKTGLGKTHLSLAIAEKVIAKGYNVLYDSIINYLRKIEREHFGKSSSDMDTLEIIMNADLLILDDLGSEYDTSFYVSTIYNIINTRLNKGLPTIISTNLTPQELENKYEARLISRLFAMYDYLKFVGSDIRHIKKKNGEI